MKSRKGCKCLKLNYECMCICANSKVSHAIKRYKFCKYCTLWPTVPLLRINAIKRSWLSYLETQRLSDSTRTTIHPKACLLPSCSEYNKIVTEWRIEAWVLSLSCFLFLLPNYQIMFTILHELTRRDSQYKKGLQILPFCQFLWVLNEWVYYNYCGKCAV